MGNGTVPKLKFLPKNDTGKYNNDLSFQISKFLEEEKTLSSYSEPIIPQFQLNSNAFTLNMINNSLIHTPFGITKTNFNKHLTSLSFTKNIKGIISHIFDTQITHKLSDHLFQIILFPYLYETNHNKTYSMLMNEKLNDILYVNNFIEESPSIEKCKTISNIDIKSISSKIKIKQRNRVGSFVDKKSNLSSEELSGTFQHSESFKDSDDYDKIFSLFSGELSRTKRNKNVENALNFFIKKKIHSIIEEEKTQNHHKKLKKLPKHRSQKTCINLFKSQAYSNLIRTINSKNNNMRISYASSLLRTSGKLKANNNETNTTNTNTKIIKDYHKQHEESLRNYFEENLSPSPRMQLNKYPKSRNKIHHHDNQLYYYIDLSTFNKTHHVHSHVNSNKDNKYHPKLFGDNYNSTTSVTNYNKTKYQNKYTSGTKRKKAKSSTNNGKNCLQNHKKTFIDKIDKLYGVSFQCQSKKKTYSNNFRQSEGEYVEDNDENEQEKLFKNSIETFNQYDSDDGDDEEDSGILPTKNDIERQLDMLEDLSNHYEDENEDNKGKREKVYSGQTFKSPKSYAKYLDMPSTKKKLEICLTYSNKH